MLLLLIGVLVSAFTISTYKTIYNTIYQERIDKIKYVITFVNEVLNYENFLVTSKQKTLQQAQKTVIEMVKRVRFGPNHYLWITGENGIMIYHPYTEMIGKNVKNYFDTKNYNFGKQIIEIPIKYGSGYVKYYWPKIKEDKKHNYLKVSYVSRFKPWGWIIGIGIYIDDIANKVISSIIIAILPVFILILLMIIIFRYIILTAIVEPLEELSSKSLRLSENDLTVTLPELKSDTEFGKLYRAFNKFINVFKEKRSNEKKLSLIMENITDVLISTDVSGKIKSANPALEKVFGYMPEEALGMDVDLLTSPELFSGNPEDFTGITYFNDKYELLGIKKTGEKFNIEVDLNEIVYDGEDFFIILIRDITIRKKFEMSRELKTHISQTKGSLGDLLSAIFPEVTGKMKNLIDTAYNNSLKLVELINYILDIEKIAAGKMEFKYEPINVSDIIEKTILINTPYAEKFQVKYKFINNVPKNTLFNVDKKIFIQILTNLILNATDVSPKDAEIIISASIKNELLCISVQDNGPGIPKTIQGNIFGDVNAEEDSDTKQKGGISLGLNICKILVEEMKGTISFETEPNKGTIFYIYFPIHSNEDFNKESGAL